MPKLFISPRGKCVGCLYLVNMFEDLSWRAETCKVGKDSFVHFTRCTITEEDNPSPDLFFSLCFSHYISN